MSGPFDPDKSAGQIQPAGQVRAYPGGVVVIEVEVPTVGVGRNRNRRARSMTATGATRWLMSSRSTMCYLSSSPLRRDEPPRKRTPHPGPATAQSGGGPSGRLAVGTRLRPTQRGPDVAADPGGIRRIKVDPQVTTVQYQRDVVPPGPLDGQFERSINVHDNSPNDWRLL